MKKIMSFVLIFCICVVTSVTTFAFSDIDNLELESELQTLQNFNIINGYADGTFKPDNYVTRAEFSKIIYQTAIFNDNYGNFEFGFHDVPKEHWAAKYIYSAKQLGIINGTSDTAFSPNNNISYEQALKMIVVALGYGDKAVLKGGYPRGYILVAEELGLTKNISIAYTDLATRADVVKMISNSLRTPFYFIDVNDNEYQLSKLTLLELHSLAIPEKVHLNQTFEDCENDIVDVG